MIRINLLPSDKKKRARRIAPTALPTGDISLGAWGAVYGGAIAVWFVVMGILYFAQSGDLEALEQENKTFEARRDQLQGKTKGLAEVEGRLEKSRRLEKVVQELERARRGPTRAVMELSKVLSIPGGPTINPAELERMREERPHLVTLDIRLESNADGIEVLRQIKEIDRTIPVVINTAYSEYKQNFGVWASEDYVVKSSNIEELKSRIALLLEKS